MSSQMLLEIDPSKFLNKPQPIKQVLMELEDFHRKIKKGEESNMPKEEKTVLWMEIVTRKDLYKRLSGMVYEQPVDISRSEKAVLRKLFFNMNGFSWSKNFGWCGQNQTATRNEINLLEASSSLYDNLNIDKPEEEEGENSASHYFIKEIDLTGIGAEGKLPDNLQNLEHCETLKMENNLINGPIPNYLTSMASLQNLKLSGNLISDEISPSLLSKLKNIKVLDLSFNDFHGEIPNVFDSLTFIEILNLSGNGFIGELPVTIGNLNRLKELKIYSNKLIGDIPESYANLQFLKHVNLSQNMLSGGFNVFNKCLRLNVLQLSHNHFTGRIDNSIEKLRKLDLLYLHKNQISGMIPDNICNLTRLKRLNLSHNNLRGRIPENIGNLINLESFLLTGNSIIGPVPSSISKLSKLRDFHIFKPFPAQFSEEERAFNKHYFDRVYVFAQTIGINSMNWDHHQVYGENRNSADDETVTIFSGSR